MNTREDLYRITAKEMARLKVAERPVGGEVTIKAAAEVLGLSTRQLIFPDTIWITFLVRQFVGLTENVERYKII